MKFPAQAPLLLVVGPTGVGKNTLIHCAVAQDPRLAFVPSLTTRPMRDREIPGDPYWFVSARSFREHVSAGKMLEWERVGHYYYGTSLEAITAAQSGERIPITDVDILGANTLLLHDALDICAVFVKSPSLEENQRRIANRGEVTVSQLAQRAKRSSLEQQCAGLCDYLLINDNLKEAAERLLWTVEAKRGARRLEAELLAHGRGRGRSRVDTTVSLARPEDAVLSGDVRKLRPVHLPSTTEGPCESLSGILRRQMILMELKTSLPRRTINLVVHSANLRETPRDAQRLARVLTIRATVSDPAELELLRDAVRVWEEASHPTALEAAE